MKFAHFAQPMEKLGMPMNRRYEQLWCELELCDELGFEYGFQSEHHFERSMPSPAMYCTGAAARTKQMRLGPMGYTVPLYDPVRIAEEAAVLDNVINGRLELGLGRGVSPYELGHYGVEAAESRAMFNEALAVLVAGLTHERLTFEGNYYQFHDVPKELSPLQQPYPPLWYPTHNPESVVYAAEHGYNLVSLGPAVAVREHVDSYWKTWEAHQHEPDRLNGHVAEPKVGIMRQVFVADTDEEAEKAAQAAHGDWYHSITKLWHAHDDHTYDNFFTWETSTQFETIIFGSPERVREQIARLLEESGCNYIICSFAWGSFTHEQALRSLNLFAEDVMPAF